jgi:hypothetical protein
MSEYISTHAADEAAARKSDVERILSWEEEIIEKLKTLSIWFSRCKSLGS